MKKVFLSIVAIAALVVIPMSVSAQTNDNITAVTSGAKIIAPMSVELNTGSTKELNFGTIASMTSENVITMGFDKAREATLGVATLFDQASTIVPEFKITGAAGYNYVVSYENITTLSDGGSQTLTLSNLDDNGDGEIDAGGTEVFKVTGKLTIPANTTAGTFTGSFDVKVSYN